LPAAGTGHASPCAVVEGRGMPASGPPGVAGVPGSTAALPVLERTVLVRSPAVGIEDAALIMAHLVESGRILHQGLAAHPRLHPGTAPGVADQPDRHAKDAMDFAAEPGADRREVGEGSVVTELPAPL